MTGGCLRWASMAGMSVWGTMRGGGFGVIPVSKTRPCLSGGKAPMRRRRGDPSCRVVAEKDGWRFMIAVAVLREYSSIRL